VQTLTSQYGREPLTVADEIPTRALEFRLGRIHVMTPPEEVEREIREAIARSSQPYTEQQVAETVAAALWIHAENRAQYVGVMLGTRF
jgi:hypothetical protein